jgi:transcription initiation factor TFIID subunit 6
MIGHWLVIEGVQPNIPENPTPQALRPTLASTPSATTAPSSSTSSTTAVTVETLEGQKYTVKHHLSKEHQMYFETVSTCLFSKDFKAVQTALHSLKHDAGIQQLLPYFVQFIAEMVMKHLRQLNYLVLLLKVINALLTNPNLFIEPYVCLRSIFPCIRPSYFFIFCL